MLHSYRSTSSRSTFPVRRSGIQHARSLPPRRMLNVAGLSKASRADGEEICLGRKTQLKEKAWKAHGSGKDASLGGRTGSSCLARAVMCSCLARFWHSHGCKLSHSPKSNLIYWGLMYGISEEHASQNKTKSITGRKGPCQSIVER